MVLGPPACVASTQSSCTPTRKISLRIPLGRQLISGVCFGSSSFKASGVKRASLWISTALSTLRAMGTYARNGCRRSVRSRDPAEGVSIRTVSNDEREVGAYMTVEAQFLT